MAHPFSFFTTTNLIITFHRIPSITWFENIVRKVAALYKFVSAREIEKYYYFQKNFNSCCHICFDDGDKSVFTNAFPILKELQIPATLFVSPKIIDESGNYWFQDYDAIRKKVSSNEIKKIIAEKTLCNFKAINQYSAVYLLKSLAINKIVDILNTIKKRHKIVFSDSENISREQLAELANSDLMTIGAHTLTHPILINESQEIARYEIKQGIKELKQLLNRDVRYFAYPNGLSKIDFTEREKKILSDADIKLAFTTDAGFFNKCTQPLKIPRIGFLGGQKENSIWVYAKILLTPFWKFVEAKKEINQRKKIRKVLSRKI